MRKTKTRSAVAPARSRPKRPAIRRACPGCQERISAQERVCPECGVNVKQALRDLRYGSPLDGPPHEPVEFEKQAVNAGVLPGVLMMIAGAAWLVGGLAFGVLFKGAPVLFVLGLVATLVGVFKWFTGRDS